MLNLEVVVNTVKGIEKFGFFVLVGILFVALIMRAYVHKLDEVISKLMFKQIHLDLFSHGKAVFLCVMVGIGLMAAITLLLQKKDHFERVKRFEFMVLGVMAVLVVVSTVFSGFMSVALSGFMDRYEGMWVWLAYLTIPFLIRLFIDDFDRIKDYMFYLVVAVSLPFLIGTAQYFRYDIITQSWFRAFVFPLDKLNEFGPIQVATNGVYTTLYNQNFVGGLVALVLPLTWYLYSVLNSKTKRMIVLFAALVATVSLVGAHSTGGYIAFIMIAFAYLLRFVLLDEKWTMGSGLPHLMSVALALVLGATNTLAKLEVTTSFKLYIAVTGLSFVGVVLVFVLKKFVPAAFFKRKSAIIIIGILLIGAGLFSISTLINRGTPSNVPTNVTTAVVDPSSPRQIVDILSDGQNVTIVTDRDQVTIAVVEGAVAILNNAGVDLPLKSTEFSNSFIPEQPEYAGYKFNIFSDQQLIEVLINGFHNGLADQQQILVRVTNDSVSVAGLDAEPIEVEKAPYIGFEGNEGFATNRGYIWSRTLPLILESPIVGHGADTFTLYFPQYDINKFKIQPNLFFVIDKPHNGFLQMAFSFGIIFLVSYLILVGTILKYLLDKLTNEKDTLALMLIIILISFNIIALINDSVVEVNPYLWIVMGLSMLYMRLEPKHKK